MPQSRDIDTLYDIELFAGRAGVELAYAITRLRATGGDPEAIELAESARARTGKAKEEATALLGRIRDRERKRRRL